MTTLSPTLTLILLLLTLSILNAEENRVVLQVNESPPIWTQKSPTGGMGSEILQAISKSSGIQSSIEFMPLKRIIADTSNNDLGNPLFYMNNQEFEQIIPIAVSYSSFFAYNKDIDTLLSQKNIKKLRIGIIKGTRVNVDVYKTFALFEESSSHKSLFRKLKAGRLDLVLELDVVGHMFTKDDDNFTSKLIERSASAIAILIDMEYPRAKEIALSYQKGLKSIINNGTYQKIIDKHYDNSVPKNWYKELKKFTAIYTLDREIE